MLGILYLLAAFTTGLIIINIICKDFIHEVPICRSWLFVFPSSFFTGTLLMAWITYIAAWLFKSASEPLLFGNLISFLIAIGFIALTIFRDRKNKIKIEFDYSSADIIYVAFSLLFSCFIMFYTFHMKNNILHVGFSVFSDFGPHLSVIRSFSHGSNFPTEYPHFPSGNIRYHFMFQFLAGNLEFLNLRLDLAFNIISILSLTSFMMLLYCLAIIITGKKQAGIIAGFLFFFRSSLSFFTYISDQSSVKEMFHKIINTNTFIGNTPHEDWGLWNLNVYANQRHLAFSLGIMALTIIILLPLTDKMKKIMHNAREKLNRTHGISIDLIKFYLFSGDLWKCQSLKRAVFLGLILGFTAFWNGAVLIGTLAILMILAFISCSRLEYIIIAVISTVLSFLQSLWVIGTQASPVKSRIIIGFLAEKKDFSGISQYYLELFGILVFIILLAWFNIPKLRFAIAAFSAPFVFANVMLLTPDIAVNHKYIMMSVMLLNIAAAAWLSELPHCDPKSFMNRTAVLAVITGSSLLLFPELSNSTGTAFSYYIIAVLLLTILYSLFNKYRKQLSLLVTAMLIFLMSCTGIVDLISFYNINKNSVKYNLNDPLLKWVEQNTDKNDLFLTPPYVTNPIMLAGRKIYLGWPYFPWSAGYDTDTRGKIVNEIYGGTNIDQIKKLIHEAGIDYIVIENENRNSKDYKLNEMLFENHFEKVYYDPAANYIIYKAGPI